MIALDFTLALLQSDEMSGWFGRLGRSPTNAVPVHNARMIATCQCVSGLCHSFFLVQSTRSCRIVTCCSVISPFALLEPRVAIARVEW